MAFLRHITLCIMLCMMVAIPAEVVARGVVTDSLEHKTTPSPVKIPTKKGTSLHKKGWWQQYSDHTTRFRAEQLVVPGALFVVGTLGIGENAPMRGINYAVRDGMTTLRNGHYLHFDDYVQYLPVATYLGLCATRAKAKHTVPERIAVAAVTYISMAALTNALKYSIREQRPDSRGRNAFPSGHTATGVAFMRLYNGRHWLNDVLAGAGVGIISARIGYWMLPLNRKIFRMDRRKTIVATPMYYPEQNALGAACAMNF